MTKKKKLTNYFNGREWSETILIHARMYVVNDIKWNVDLSERFSCSKEKKKMLTKPPTSKSTATTTAAAAAAVTINTRKYTQQRQY